MVYTSEQHAREEFREPYIEKSMWLMSVSDSGQLGSYTSAHKPG